jgi:2-keto-3-deoxy-L-rhamnonate aldolase RhmA
MMDKGSVVVGTMFRVVNSPAAALLARNAGMDFIMLDLEHGPYAMETVANIASTVRSVGLGLFVRVPELARGWVSRALDSGATGVMVPMIESAEQARLLAGWAKYPPLGGRGLSSIGWHTDYAAVEDAGRMMQESNERVWAIAQVESAEGSRNAEEIAAVEGIDALLVGPNDLSVSLECPGETTTPAVSGAIERIAVAAKNHGKVFGMHAGPDMLGHWVHHGLTLRMSLLDANLLAKGLADVEKQVRALGT